VIAVTNVVELACFGLMSVQTGVKHLGGPKIPNNESCVAKGMAKWRAAWSGKTIVDIICGKSTMRRSSV
jgi:hypothetical protein